MSFDGDISRFAKRTGLEVEKVVRVLAIEAYQRVTRKTPVDTGRARANWNFSVGKMDVSVDSKKDYPKSTGKHRGSSSPPTTPRMPFPNVKKGDGEQAIYITNSLPYISALEHGREAGGKSGSTQAPRGMVGLTINELRHSIE